MQNYDYAILVMHGTEAKFLEFRDGEVVTVTADAFEATRFATLEEIQAEIAASEVLRSRGQIIKLERLRGANALLAQNRRSGRAAL